MGSSESTGHLSTDELFRRYAGFVARFLTRLGVPPEQLEDSLQEVFLVVHRNGGYRPGIAKPTSYLANMAIHAAYRHRQRHERASIRHSERPVEQMPSEFEDPAHTFQVHQDLRRLQRALDCLPDELRTTLLLVDMEGESCVSVAAGLSCPVGTVYSRLHVARKRLQAALNADAPRRISRSGAAGEKQPQRARSLLLLFGFGGFERSEAARLLRLARDEQIPALNYDRLFVWHKQLVAAGAQSPASYGACASHATSWITLVGAGPIAGALVVGALVLGTKLVVAERSTPDPHVHVLDAVAATQAAEVSQASEPTSPPQSYTPSRYVADETEQRPLAATTADAAASPAKRERSRRERTLRKAVAEPRWSRSSVTAPDDTSLEHVNSGSERQATSQGQEVGQNTATEPRPNSVDSDAAPDVANPAAKPGTAAHADAMRNDVRLTTRVMPDAEREELREITRAEQLLSSDPEDALALTRAMRARFPQGNLREERAYLEVIALLELRRTHEMRTRAAAFLKAYPDGLYSGRVRAALARDVK